MGNCNFIHDRMDPEAGKVHLELNKQCFSYEYAIGKGGFGRVWKVVDRRSSKMYAMKEMLKSRILSRRSVTSVLNERRLLSLLKHPFLVNMISAFQDKENLFLVMDLMTGGDLRFHLGRQKVFTEEQTRFFIACILTGLEYLHIHKVIHRDIKPENLVLDDRGYLRITDFGIARALAGDNADDTSGTPGYMAPEVMCRQAHGLAVDYFALGVIMHEFMMHKRPYVGKNRKEVKEQIFARQVQLRRTDIPLGWSMEAADFANKLLERRPRERLGYNGPAEVKNHAWLRGFPWGKLIEKKLPAPYRPEIADNFDERHLGEWRDQEEVMKSAQLLERDPFLQSLFQGYFYDQNGKKRRESEITLSSGVETGAKGFPMASSPS
jgi:serine/threonine protein kinase